MNLNDIDLEESIIEVEGEQMTLIEFLETNSDGITPVETLEMIQSLLSDGTYDLADGTFSYTPIKLIRLAKLSEREA